MKKLLFLLLMILPAFAQESSPLPEKPSTRVVDDAKDSYPMPEKPANRVFDDANIFEQSARERLVRVLESENKKYNITVYVVTIPTLDKADPVAFADKMQKTWITEGIGFVMLYTRSNDKISISLTPAAYKKLVEKSKLDDMASEIDLYNQEGPTRGIPKAVNAILNRLRVSRDDGGVSFLQPEKETSPLLILIPIGIVLLAMALGLWKLYRFLDRQNVFDHTYRLKASPVRPHFGALQGGVNIGSGSFR